MATTLPTARCPFCMKRMDVKDGKFVTHGPGKDTFTCEGSGKSAVNVRAAQAEV